MSADSTTAVQRPQLSLPIRVTGREHKSPADAGNKEYVSRAAPYPYTKARGEICVAKPQAARWTLRSTGAARRCNE